MSIQYQKKIFSSEGIELYINFSGINEEDYTNTTDLTLTLYAVDTTDLTPIFSETLSFDQVVEIYNHLNSVSIIRDKSKNKTNKFVEVTSEINEILPLIESVDSSLLKKILDKAGENKKLQLIVDTLTHSEIENLYASIKQTTYQYELNNLKQLLELEESTDITESIKEFEDLSEYTAGQPEKIFQNWIEKNIWTLGTEYIQKHPARKIGISSESDLIMETTDGFIDLIELKRPIFDLFSYDDSHKSYYPSRELSKVIGQCMQYLNVLEDYKLLLEKEYAFKLLKPRIKIIVGRSENFNDAQIETLRILNSSLNHMQIITYDYLHTCGENILSFYQKEEII